MRRLIIMRHAKAAHADNWDDDINRPLDPRGRDEAPRTARLLADLCPPADLALVSSAQRTRETWELVAPHYPAHATQIDDNYYLASGEMWLNTLVSAGDAETVLIIGHNPGLKELAYDLMSKGPHDTDARVSLSHGLPTSCALVLELDDAPARNTARLTAFVKPPRGADTED